MVSEIFFSKCGHFGGTLGAIGLSILANTPDLILPCCPNGKPKIRSQKGVKGHQVHYIVVNLFCIFFLFMFILQNKKQFGLSTSANIPGINVSNLQCILTLHKVTKGSKGHSVYIKFVILYK